MQAKARGLPPPLLLGLLEKRERRAALRDDGLEAFLRLLQASQDEPGVGHLVYLALGDGLKAVQGADGAGRGETSGAELLNGCSGCAAPLRARLHAHLAQLFARLTASLRAALAAAAAAAGEGGGGGGADGGGGGGGGGGSGGDPAAAADAQLAALCDLCNCLLLRVHESEHPLLAEARIGETLDALQRARGAGASLCRRLYRHLVLDSFALHSSREQADLYP